MRQFELRFIVLLTVTLEETETFTNNTKHFLSDIKKQNEDALRGKQTQEIFHMILQATIEWNASDSGNEMYTTNGSSFIQRIKRNLRVSTTLSLHEQERTVVSSVESHEEEYSIEEHIAHICHFASVAILGIVSLEVG